MLLLLVALHSGFAAAQATPTLMLSPESVSLNRELTATGQGFRARETVALSIGLAYELEGSFTASVGTVETDAEGAFNFTFEMPALWDSGLPIQEADLALVATGEDSEANVSVPFTYDVPALVELGWQEVYNERWNFSVMAPGDWAVKHYDDGFELAFPESDTPVVTVRASLAQEMIEGEPTSEMSLWTYAAIAANYELGGAAMLERINLRPATMRTGRQGVWADYAVDFGDWVDPMSIVYFDLNELRDGYLYKTIQVVAYGEETMDWLRPVVNSFDRGHQPTVLHEQPEHGFRLYLPPDWELRGANETPYGIEYEVGESALGSSFIAIADAGEHTLEDEKARLSELRDNANFQIAQTFVAGEPATLLRFAVDEITYAEYFIIERGGKLYTLHVHNADSLATRYDILAGYAFLDE